MESLVHSYLSKHFEIKTSDAGNDGIYLKSNTRRDRAPYYHITFLRDIAKIFGMDDVKIIKSYTNSWSISIKEDVNLKFYWANPEDLLV